MKLTKKLSALALALMMVGSTMAMPAAAAGDEGIMPLYSTGVCPVHNVMEQIHYIDDTNNSLVSSCSRIPSSHYHSVGTRTYVYECGHTEGSRSVNICNGK